MKDSFANLARGTLVYGLGKIAALLDLLVTSACAIFALGPLLMVTLLHAWNRSRGARYLDVPYEWGRVGGCVAVTALLALPYTWPRELPLTAELALGAAGALAALSLAWLALGPSERRAVRGFLSDQRRGGAGG